MLEMAGPEMRKDYEVVMEAVIKGIILPPIDFPNKSLLLLYR